MIVLAHCNQFESITTEVKEPDSQEARTKLSIETRTRA